VSEREIEAKYVDLHCRGGAGFYFSDPDLKVPGLNLRVGIIELT
jgi:hypothetical protein